MDIRKVIEILKRWYWLLLLGAIIAGGLGYYISSRETPMYQASTRFVVLRAATTSYDYNAFLDYQELVLTYTQLLSTDKLLKQVSEEVGFPVYSGQINAEQVGESNFVRINVTHEDPVKVAAVANTLVSTLIEQNEILQNVRYETTRQNLTNRADQALVQMGILQDQIEILSEETLQEQITEVQSQIEDLQAKATDLEFKIANIDRLDPTEQDIFERIQYAAELDQIKPLLEMYQEIYTQLVVMGEPVQNEDTSAAQIRRLERTLSLYEQIYFTSISSLENLNLTQLQSTPNVVQVEPATVPSRPFAPRPMQNAGLFGAVGLLSMAGIAFLVEYLDDTIKTPDDVKNVLGLPVIGFIGDMDESLIKRKEGRRNVFVLDQPRSPISEAFRSIRTSLEFYSVDAPLQLLIVTSSGPEEGKTTVATNLAAILARGNRKVLLLDIDLRRPNVHNLTGLSNRIGVSDLLRGKKQFEDVIQVYPDDENLHIITSGSLPPNPAELVASNKMKSIIEAFKEHYDMIVIDTPPAIVTDAQILASIADGVIYVLRPGKTRLVAARTPLEEFERVNANMIGVVMNRIPKNRGYYYGGYEYYAPGAHLSEKYYKEGNHHEVKDETKGAI
jgi:capsular exopolysaccharide synthesis family protein